MKKKIFPAILIAAFLIISGKIEKDKLETKRIEKSMVKISDSLYACKYEAANLEYRIFENELRENRPEDYKIAAVDSEEWQKKFPFAFHDPLTKMYGWHPAYNVYPVVNVSYEGASLFCSWLSEKYNSWTGRNFKKVRFRLPTVEEWIVAAKGGKELQNYPFGNYLRDEKGKYLCNFRSMGDERIAGEVEFNKFKIISDQSVHRGQFMDDAATYTAAVNAYWPNGFGLYNMSGNAAEMTIEKGIAHGGSWCDTGYDVRIESTMSYNKPSPLVGFRYFMEVLEK